MCVCVCVTMGVTIKDFPTFMKSIFLLLSISFYIHDTENQSLLRECSGYGIRILCKNFRSVRTIFDNI